MHATPDTVVEEDAGAPTGGGGEGKAARGPRRRLAWGGLGDERQCHATDGPGQRHAACLPASMSGGPCWRGVPSDRPSRHRWDCAQRGAPGECPKVQRLGGGALGLGRRARAEAQRV